MAADVLGRTAALVLGEARRAAAAVPWARPWTRRGAVRVRLGRPRPAPLSQREKMAAAAGGCRCRLLWSAAGGEGARPGAGKERSPGTEGRAGGAGAVARLGGRLGVRERR